MPNRDNQNSLQTLPGAFRKAQSKSDFNARAKYRRQPKARMHATPLRPLAEQRIIIKKAPKNSVETQDILIIPQKFARGASF